MLAMLKIGDFVEFVDVAPVAVPIPSHWYLIGVRPGREKSVLRAFDLRAWSAYSPVVFKSIWNSRGSRQLVERPMFPGMVFVPDFDADLERLRQVDGVTSFVRFGERPICLPSKIVDDVRRIEAACGIAPSKRELAFRRGALLRVESGPFVGWEGRFDGLDDRGRLRVGLDIFGKETILPLDVDDVSEVIHRPPS